jgi:phage terminase small subunit
MRFHKSPPALAPAQSLNLTPPPAAAAPSVSRPDTPPSFAELDEREARFVVEYLLHSGKPGAAGDAALAAGYSNGDRDAARGMASRLLRRPAVLKAIKDETGRRLAASAPLGVAVLESLAKSAKSEQVRLAAARELIDRGFGPVVSRNANTNLNVTTGIEELLKRREEAREAGFVDITPAEVERPD